MPKADRDERLLNRLIEFAGLLAAAISVLAVLGLNRGTVIAIALPALLASFFLILAGRRLTTVRRIPVTIALGGSSGVGKTVFANVVANRLSEGDSRLLRFVPETRTAQRIYRVITDLRNGEWPANTGTDNIERYRGIVELDHQPLARRLLQGRLEFGLEVGDSAGELWDELGEESAGGSQRLIDSSFFEYIGESSALFYFIDALSLRDEPDQVANQVDDLLSTLQVLRSLERGGARLVTKPIALIISKADLIESKERSMLEHFLSAEPQAKVLGSGGPFSASLEHLAYLDSVMERQAGAFRIFLVSSLRDSRRVLSEFEGSDVEADDVVRPVEWTLRTVMARARRRVLA
ncbi:MAG: hypothetical protein ACTHK6_07075 [Solirubrobacterales bacterium]